MVNKLKPVLILVIVFFSISCVSQERLSDSENTVIETQEIKGVAQNEKIHLAEIRDPSYPFNETPNKWSSILAENGKWKNIVEVNDSFLIVQSSLSKILVYNIMGLDLRNDPLPVPYEIVRRSVSISGCYYSDSYVWLFESNKAKTEMRIIKIELSIDEAPKIILEKEIDESFTPWNIVAKNNVIYSIKRLGNEILIINLNDNKPSLTSFKIRYNSNDKGESSSLELSGMKLLNDVIYLVSLHNGMYSIKIENDNSLKILDRIDVIRPWSLNLYNEMAYITANNGLYIVDVSKPDDLSIKSQFAAPYRGDEAGNGFKVDNRYIVFKKFSAVRGNFIQIFDITDPENIVLISETPIDITLANIVHLKGTRSFWGRSLYGYLYDITRDDEIEQVRIPQLQQDKNSELTLMQNYYGKSVVKSFQNNRVLPPESLRTMLIFGVGGRSDVAESSLPSFELLVKFVGVPETFSLRRLEDEGGITFSVIAGLKPGTYTVERIAWVNDKENFIYLYRNVDFSLVKVEVKENMFTFFPFVLGMVSDKYHVSVSRSEHPELTHTGVFRTSLYRGERAKIILNGQLDNNNYNLSGWLESR